MSVSTYNLQMVKNQCKTIVQNLAGIAISAGSACHSGTYSQSRATAMGYHESAAKGTIRLTLADTPQ